MLYAPKNSNISRLLPLFYSNVTNDRVLSRRHAPLLYKMLIQVSLVIRVKKIKFKYFWLSQSRDGKVSKVDHLHQH